MEACVTGSLCDVGQIIDEHGGGVPLEPAGDILPQFQYSVIRTVFMHERKVLHGHHGEQGLALRDAILATLHLSRTRQQRQNEPKASPPRRSP